MNNEVLEKIEEYNNGGLFNEPITFSSSVNHMDAATLLNLFTPPPISSGCCSFSFPKEKTVDLIAEQTVDTMLIRDDPASMERYIRNELAQKLAKQLIEEDLIQIQSCEDIEHMNTRFRAKIKVVQE